MNLFWKHVLSVFMGTVIVQLIPIFGSVVIARIFSPSDFGVFSTWLAIVSFISVVITLRLETVLPITADGFERTRSVFIVFILTTIIAVVFFICSFAVQLFPEINYYFPHSPFLINAVIPAAFFLALNQIWQTWAAAEGFYGKLNAMRLVQALTLVLFQISAGFHSPTALSLVIGFVVASGVAFVWAVTIMPKFFHKELFGFLKIKMFLSRYKNCPLYALPADAINTAAGQLPILVISYRFGNEVAGYLALTMRVLGAPIGLVGKAVLDVFKRYAILSIQKTGECQSLYINTLMVLFFASVIMVFGTVLWAEDIFNAVFGSEWAFSGVMAVWLLPMFALRMIASPLSYMTYLVEKQHVDLIWQIGLLVMTIATLYVFPSYQTTLIGHSAGYAFMYLLYILISYRLSKG